MNAWIYVFSAPQGVKIGMTTGDPERRRRGVQTGSGTPVALVSAYSADLGVIYEAESRAHRLLTAVRTYGEWFSCSPEQAVAVVQQMLAESEEDHACPRVYVQPKPRSSPASPYGPIAASGRGLLKALAEAGGRATPDELRARLDDSAVGYGLRNLRNRGLIEAWMDVAVLTQAGRDLA